MQKNNLQDIFLTKVRKQRLSLCFRKRFVSVFP